VERGSSYLVTMAPRDEDYGWRHYVMGRPEELRSRFLDSGTDPRSLIVRMLVATRRVAPRGLGADDIATFLEGSFGAFQQKMRQGTWAWDRNALANAIADLVRHGLVIADPEGLHTLTDLGRLAGETAIEVASVIRLVDSLRQLRVDEITDPALIAATQNTRELDGVNVPMNKKNLKEAQTWLGMLRMQGIVDRLLACFSREVREPHEQGPAPNARSPPWRMCPGRT
jgi:helicase